MLGLGLSIFTDVRGIDKKSGSAASAKPVSSTVTARSSFGLRGTNIKVYAVPQVNTIANVNIVSIG